LRHKPSCVGIRRKLRHCHVHLVSGIFVWPAYSPARGLRRGPAIANLRRLQPRVALDCLPAPVKLDEGAE
jgi:hypothetical protein